MITVTPQGRLTLDLSTEAGQILAMDLLSGFAWEVRPRAEWEKYLAVKKAVKAMLAGGSAPSEELRFGPTLDQMNGDEAYPEGEGEAISFQMFCSERKG